MAAIKKIIVESVGITEKTRAAIAEMIMSAVNVFKFDSLARTFKFDTMPRSFGFDSAVRKMTAFFRTNTFKGGR